MGRPKILEDAIEKLYVAFASYPLAKDTKPCSCCHSPAANDLLHAKPLRELGWQHLSEYSVEAMNVWGGLDDYKHFLPRIFDLLLSNPRWPGEAPNPESVFGGFRRGDWRAWPIPEQSAIEEMLRAIWEAVLSNPPIEGGYIDVEMWLCCISQCEVDISSYLAQWMKDERLSSSWALSSLILGGEIQYVGDDHIRPAWEDSEAWRTRIQEWSDLPHRGAFWDDCWRQYAQLQEFLKTPAVIQKLSSAEMDSASSSEMKREFATARQCLLEVETTKFERIYRNRKFQTAFWESPTYRLF